MNNIPTKEQLADPDWWDENDPSGGEATHYAPTLAHEDNSYDQGWVNENTYWGYDYQEWQTLYASLEKYKEDVKHFIPRPERDTECKELEDMRDILKKANDIPYSLQEIEQMLKVLGG